jgi:hypothetical protein
LRVHWSPARSGSYSIRCLPPVNPAGWKKSTVACRADPGRARHADDLQSSRAAGIAEVKPNSWKGYTIGDPLQPQTTKYPWRLDDEKLVYPFYDKAVKAGITTVCIHKGLLPKDYETAIPGGAWKYANVDDLPKAAKTGRRSIS